MVPSIIQCPHCGGSVQREKGELPTICEYCGGSFNPVGEQKTEEFFDIDCMLDLAQVAREAGRFEEAIGRYTAILEHDSKIIEAWLARGIVLCDRNRWREAKADFNKALSLGDGTADSGHRIVGWIANRLEDQVIDNTILEWMICQDSSPERKQWALEKTGELLRQVVSSPLYGYRKIEEVTDFFDELAKENEISFSSETYQSASALIHDIQVQNWSESREENTINAILMMVFVALGFVFLILISSGG